MLCGFKNQLRFFLLLLGITLVLQLEARVFLIPSISNEIIAQNANQADAEKFKSNNKEALKEVQAIYENLKVYSIQNNIDSVESNLKRLQDYQQSNEYFRIYYLMGRESYESLINNYQAAIETSFQSLALAEEYQIDELVPEILNNLGANFLLLEELESAQQYFMLALREGDLVSD